MTERICPECGSDIYRAAAYQSLLEARDRHWQKNRKQAIEILRLELRVAELEEWQRTRNRKIEMQRRTIRRLEEKLRGMGARPHDDKGLGEGDPASPVPAINQPEPSAPDDFPIARELRRMHRRTKNNDQKGP